MDDAKPYPYDSWPQTPEDKARHTLSRPPRACAHSLAPAGGDRVERRSDREADRGHAVAAADAAVPEAAAGAAAVMGSRLEQGASLWSVTCLYIHRHIVNEFNASASSSLDCWLGCDCEASRGLAATRRLASSAASSSRLFRSCSDRGGTVSAHAGKHDRRSTHIGTAVGKLERRVVEHGIKALDGGRDFADACSLLRCRRRGD